MNQYLPCIADIVKLSSTSSTTEKFQAVPQSTENSYSSVQPRPATSVASTILIASFIEPGPENTTTTLTEEELDTWVPPLACHEQVDKNGFEKFLEELFNEEEKTWPVSCSCEKAISPHSRKRPLELKENDPPYSRLNSSVDIHVQQPTHDHEEIESYINSRVDGFR